MSRPTLLALLGVGLACHADTILVNDQFTDLERLTEGLPASLQWTYGAHHGTAASAFTSLDASSGALVWDHTQSAGVNSFSATWGHFTGAATPLTLAIGERLTLSFQVSFSGGGFSAGTNAFRWALFDSNGSRVTTDFAGTNATGLASGTTFSTWRGYAAQTTVSSSDFAGINNFLTRERTGSGNGLYTSADYMDVTGSPVEEMEFTVATTYTFTLELNRTASGMEVRGSVNGIYTALATDTTPVLEFDTISLFTADALTHNVTVDNVQLTHVPEPSAGLLLGAGLLGLSRRVRRR